MPKTESIIKPILSKKFLKRRFARILAIQCLYSINFSNLKSKSTDDKIADIIDIYENELSTSKLSKSNHGYFIFLVRSCIEHNEKIETLISDNLDYNWKLNRLSQVISAILKIGATELKMSTELNVSIIINEYLEIARFFGHAGDAGFVNYILDKIANEELLHFNKLEN